VPHKRYNIALSAPTVLNASEVNASGIAVARAPAAVAKIAAEAVSRKNARALFIRCAGRKYGLLKRHHHADGSGLWIHRADKNDWEKQGQVLESGYSDSCRPRRRLRRS